MLQSLRKNKVVKNAGWIIGGKVANKLLAFVVGIFAARYLGPSNYGLINYAAAYATFFASLCTLSIILWREPGSSLPRGIFFVPSAMRSEKIPKLSGQSIIQGRSALVQIVGSDATSLSMGTGQ